MSQTTTTVYYGPLINPQGLRHFQALPRCLLAVSPSGQIDWVVDDVPDSMVQEVMAQKGCLEADVVALKTGEFLMPGFVDTHTHAPQVPNMGCGQQYQLLDWLSNVTFPMEAKCADLEFAQETYKSVVRRIIASGYLPAEQTTTCCYYGTLHLDATKALADIVHSFGQRAFVGKCNMDRNSPDNYIEPSAENSIAATKELITHIHSLAKAASSTTQPLVQPILTPRFAISCTGPLLSSLGTLAAADPTLRIQTHISENPSEVAFTKSLFPECTSYAGVYDAHGLLRENTVLAHAVHLEEAEVDLIAERKAGISHCPTSNFNLSSGVARVGYYLDRGIKVGLGTDVSGGFSPSILTAIQHASIAAKVIAMQSATAVPPVNTTSTETFSNQQLTIASLLYLATLGGAQVCCLDESVGSFASGKSFDALIVSTRNDAGNPALWAFDKQTQDVTRKGLEDMLEKFFFCGDDRNISRVYVQGRFIGGREFGI